MNVIIMILFMLVVLLSVGVCVALVCLQTKLCKRKSNKRFVLPIVSICCAPIAFFALIVLSRNAYSASESLSNVGTFDEIWANEEGFEKRVRQLMDNEVVDEEMEAIWDQVDRVTVESIGSQVKEVLFYDKNNEAIFSYRSELANSAAPTGGIALVWGVWFFLLIWLELIILFVITLVKAVSTNTRKVSETEEINILNM